MMGRDRIHDHEHAGAEVITANDMSCLMHLEGLIRRDKKPLRVMHIAELLVEAMRGAPVRRPSEAVELPLEGHAAIPHLSDDLLK
jgi:hypothetical protein